MPRHVGCVSAFLVCGITPPPPDCCLCHIQHVQLQCLHCLYVCQGHMYSSVLNNTVLSLGYVRLWVCTGSSSTRLVMMLYLLVEEMGENVVLVLSSIGKKAVHAFLATYIQSFNVILGHNFLFYAISRRLNYLSDSFYALREKQ